MFTGSRAGVGWFHILFFIIVVCFHIQTVRGKSWWSHGQDDFFYYYETERIPLKLSSSQIVVRYKNVANKNFESSAMQSLPVAINTKFIPEKNLRLYQFFPNQTLPPIRALAQNILLDQRIVACYPVFEAGNCLLIPDDEIILQFAANVSDIEKAELLAAKNLQQIPHPLIGDNFILAHSNDPREDVIYLANQLYEEKGINFSEPNFIRIMPQSSNDPFYDSQWHLNNLGGAPVFGTADADIDAPEAWEINSGAPTITIAIIDLGVDISHPDLIDNLIGGYDSYDEDNDPTPDSCEAHGTACAGLAAAVTDNNLGVAGVAPGCKIMPVRMGTSDCENQLIITTNAAIASAINWAWQNGADVLSSSWGGGLPSTVINTAIQNATTSGRGNRGCVVVFAAGNENTSVNWPATREDVIAVGATNYHDQRCDESDWGDGAGSNYGPELDVVAPGIQLYTTDNTGDGGYAIDDYYPYFGGTSGACPIVAGVAALILSVNPTLSSFEVQSILQTTADDQVGRSNEDTAGRDPYHGYGRVNAFNALSSMSTLCSITVVIPNGGESLRPENSQLISWTSEGGSGNVQIEYTRDGGVVWNTIVAMTPDDGEYYWTVPALSSTQCKVKISDVNENTCFDESDNLFTIEDISPCQIEVIVPNGSELWQPATRKTISWSLQNGNIGVNLYFSLDGGQTYQPIVENYSESLCYDWRVPEVQTPSARIKISAANNPSCFDVSDGDFVISPRLTPNIVASDIYGEAGDTRVVELRIFENSLPINSFGLQLLFNTQHLSFEQVTTGNLTADWLQVSGLQNSPGQLIIGGYNTAAIGSGSSGSIAKVQFQISCTSCDTCDQSILQIVDLQDDISTLTAYSGLFNYGNTCGIGDVNRDGALTPLDALCAFQIYLNTGEPPSDGACDTDCAIEASDSNCDGMITPLDALLIFQAYLEGNNTIQCPPERVATNISTPSRLGTKSQNKNTIALPDVFARVGEVIDVPIKLKSAQGISSFGFVLSYPPNELQFKGIKPSSRTKSWLNLDAKVALAGVATIGGFDIGMIESTDLDTLLYATFQVKGAVSTSKLVLYNLVDDIATFTPKFGNISVTAVASTVQTLALFQNHPNPFNAETAIEYTLPKLEPVEISITDINGREVRTLEAGSQVSGTHRIIWNGSDNNRAQLPSGIYFCTLQFGSAQKVIKMLLLR